VERTRKTWGTLGSAKREGAGIRMGGRANNPIKNDAYLRKDNVRLREKIGQMREENLSQEQQENKSTSGL